MMDGDGPDELGEWLDCECPECGAWFPVSESRCPSCGARSRCTGVEEGSVDGAVDQMMGDTGDGGHEWVEMEDPPLAAGTGPMVEPTDPNGRWSTIGKRLRTIFT